MLEDFGEKERGGLILGFGNVHASSKRNRREKGKERGQVLISRRKRGSDRR